MEDADRTRILRALTQNHRLKRLYEEHAELEHAVARFEARNFLTPAEERSLKEMKFRKLRGVEEMMQIVGQEA